MRAKWKGCVQCSIRAYAVVVAIGAVFAASATVNLSSTTLVCVVGSLHFNSYSMKCVRGKRRREDKMRAMRKLEKERKEKGRGRRREREKRREERGQQRGETREEREREDYLV